MFDVHFLTSSVLYPTRYPLSAVRYSSPSHELRTTKTERRNKRWLERFAAWEAHDEALAAFSEAEATYKEELKQYESALTAHEQALKDRAVASDRLRKAIAKRLRAVEQLTGDLAIEAANTEVRMDIAGRRLAYLEKLLEYLLRDWHSFLHLLM